MQAQELLRGDFQRYSLGNVLQGLSDADKTGVLLVDGGGEIWMSEGSVYLARTPASDPIADVLYGLDAPTEAEIDELLRDGGHQAARQLAERYPEMVSSLDRLLHEFNLAALFELIVPSSKTYTFEEARLHPIGARFGEPASELVAQAERRLEIWTRIAAKIPSTSMAFKVVRVLPEDQEERVVSADEWRYLAALHGGTTVAQVISETGESAFRVCSSLYRLLLEGLIEEA